MSVADRDLYPHVEFLSGAEPEQKPERGAHRGTVSGGWPALSHTGEHVRPGFRVWPYLLAVLVPVTGVLLILAAVHLFSPAVPATVVPATVPVPVSSTPCTFPDGY